MNGGKDCSLCVYRDGVRPGGTWKCCSPDRQHDLSIIDCCILETPLRELQASTKDAEDFAYVTHTYIDIEKKKSSYWRKQIKNSAER